MSLQSIVVVAVVVVVFFFFTKRDPLIFPQIFPKIYSGFSWHIYIHSRDDFRATAYERELTN